MDDLNDSGMENPIFEIMNLEENRFQNMIMPPLISAPPIIPLRNNNNNKKYSNETIDKMILTLKDFNNNNINNIMETTKRMNNIIDKYESNFINIHIAYKGNYNNFIKCKLNEKISDALKKIKIENFDINNKLVISNGRNLDINKTFKDENLIYEAYLFIVDK